jgi:AAA+ ATPase superfamily predicted ATPase
MAAGVYVPRLLDLVRLAARKSLFLFGPRQTGKTALIRHALPGAKVYDLLDGDVFLSAEVTLLRDEQSVATLAPDPQGFASFAGVTLMDGRHTLVAQAESGDGPISSPPISVDVNEGA